MAPEIVRKTEFCGPPTDIYAAGVLLFAFFCGCFPFRGANDKELYTKIAKAELNVPEHVPSQPRQLIQKMMDKNPEKRPTASELFAESWVQSGVYISLNTKSSSVSRQSSQGRRPALVTKLKPRQVANGPN